MVWVLVAVLWVVTIAVVVIYNRLVKLRVEAENAWSDIDVQLKRRHDLIPNLVETVKGYAAHESSTLQAVVEARAGAVAARGADPEARARAEGALTQALRGMAVVVEAYPQLQASGNFRDLQASLNAVEDAIQNARRYYNAVVRELNTRIQQFPSNVVAGLFSFRQREFFEAAEQEREVPQVKF